MELAALIGRLNPDCRRALERAAQRCLQRTHHYVEIEHLLLELLDIDGGDFACLLPRFGLERDALVAEINLSLELFKAGNTRTPALSAHTIGLLEDAVVHASVLGQAQIRSGLLLLAPARPRGAPRPAAEQRVVATADSPRGLAGQPAGVDPDLPRTAGRAEPPGGRRRQAGKRPGPAARPVHPGPHRRSPRRAHRPHSRARRGDPPVRRHPPAPAAEQPDPGRRAGRRQDRGGRGPGLRIAAGEVPPSLQEVILRVLDLGLLQAGASMKGEFEQRLKG